MHNQIVWIGAEIVATQILDDLESQKEEIETKLQEILDADYDKTTLKTLLTNIVESLEE